eukprot:ctg_325.g92
MPLVFLNALPTSSGRWRRCWQDLLPRGTCPRSTAAAAQRNPAVLRRGPMAGSLEVEKKFVLSPETEQRLLEILSSSSSSSSSSRSRQTLRFTDIYYDAAHTWTLTSSNRWLRQRQGVWELKVPITGASQRRLDAYRELVFEADIRAELGWAPAEALAAGRIAAFAHIETERVSIMGEHAGRRVRIDLDRADYGYTVGEIETLAHDEDDVAAAERDVLALAVAAGLQAQESPRGKLAEFLHRHRPEHYAALMRAGILRSKR